MAHAESVGWADNVCVYNADRLSAPSIARERIDGLATAAAAAPSRHPYALSVPDSKSCLD